MTKEECRNHPEYKRAHNKIVSYPVGFKFSIPYSEMPRPLYNAIRVILGDCKREGLIDSVSMDLSLNGEITSESFVRI